jgi:hypothetical protein
MEAGKWSSQVPKKLPVIKMHDSDRSDGIDTFLVWNPKDFALFLASYIIKYDGNYARWFSTNDAKQAEYRRKVESIKAKFV